MGLLCFALDIASIEPLLLKDIKQIHVAYKPKDKLDLREFHRIVNSLPSSSSSLLSRGHPGSGSSPFTTSKVASLATLLNEPDGILSWGFRNSYKKIIMITNHFSDGVETFEKFVMEAAENCVRFDFIQIERTDSQHVQDGSIHLEGYQLECLSDFALSVAEFENCTFQRVSWDPWLFNALVKQWLQDIIYDIETSLEVTLVFQHPLFEERTRVYCTFFPALMQLADIIEPCKTCRCHGAVLDAHVGVNVDGALKSCCPLTRQELDVHDLASNSIKVGYDTVLYLPSFKSSPESPLFSRTSLTFNVIKSVSLATLSEGLLFGHPHVVSPSSEFEIEGEVDNLENNDQIFSALCCALDAKDWGLVCRSTSDVDCLIESSFPCYYLLLPAKNRTLLARRLATSEEFLAPPRSVGQARIPDFLRDSVIQCLSRIGVEDYNPLTHERGCNARLNSLVKESLLFRPMPLVQKVPKSSTEKQSPNCWLNEEENVVILDNPTLELNSHRKSCNPPDSLKLGNMQNSIHNQKQPLCKTPSSVHSFPLEKSSQQGRKASLPLQNRSKPQQNHINTDHSSSSKLLKPTTTSEPQLRANFRRIKQGRV